MRQWRRRDGRRGRRVRTPASRMRVAGRDIDVSASTATLAPPLLRCSPDVIAPLPLPDSSAAGAHRQTAPSDSPVSQRKLCPRRPGTLDGVRRQVVFVAMSLRPTHCDVPAGDQLGTLATHGCAALASRRDVGSPVRGGAAASLPIIAQWADQTRRRRPSSTRSPPLRRVLPSSPPPTLRHTGTSQLHRRLACVLPYLARAAAVAQPRRVLPCSGGGRPHTAIAARRLTPTRDGTHYGRHAATLRTGTCGG